MTLANFIIGIYVIVAPMMSSLHVPMITPVADALLVREDGFFVV